MIVGVDPGLSGALAFLNHESLHVEDMPTLNIQRGGKSKRDLDLTKLCAILRWRLVFPCHCYVEQVGAMPGQGVSSMFAFGKSYGAVLGILAALNAPYTLVTPRQWKKDLQVPKGKDASRARASQLMPRHSHLWTRVKDDGRAEAALIAAWGDRQ